VNTKSETGPAPQEPLVLVVDDNTAGRYAMVRALRARGFRTVESAGGAQALQEAAQNGVAAVVLDVHLPDLHGFEVCRQLRARPETAHLPVIQVSAVYVLDEHRIDGLGSGANAYMLSPVEPSVLAATLRSMIEASAAQQALRVSELRLRGLFEAAGCAMALVDPVGCIVEANEAFAKRVGKRREFLPGRTLEDFGGVPWIVTPHSEPGYRVAVAPAAAD
jgi:CheY-like chemotaxis protein